MREIKFRYWDDLNNKMVYDVERGGQFGFYLKNYECMQYVGIKDKNGKDIYEGDIIRHYTNSQNYIGVIRWYEWSYIDATNKKLFAEQMNFKKHAEVVGNIYENPELLKNVSQNPVNG